MHPSIVASAIAARDLGYVGIAQLILEQQLGPQAIARLFTMSASSGAPQACAVIVLAAATARFNSCREGFNGDVERELAEDAVGIGAGFTKANRVATEIVAGHWDEISASALPT